MVRSLNSGVSGIQQFQGKLDVIGNNISNASTTGYKKARADFEDSFSQTLQVPGASTGAGIQVGSGVLTGAVRSIFNQGTIAPTYRNTDMAISGDGFFVVRDPINGREFVTRSGEFDLDSQGFLITGDGLRVQGYNDSGLTTLGDIRIDTTGAPAGTPPGAAVAGFTVDEFGVISVTLTGGQATFTRGQILLQRFQNPGALVKEGGNLYSGMTSAGALGAPSAPNTNGLGYVKWAHLEMSNVDLATEFASMITTQRGFQASARIITTSDEMLQEVVNLKR